MARLTVTITDGAVASSHMSGVTRREGKVVGFVESFGRPRAAQCELMPNGSLQYSLQGCPSLGEDGTMRSCEIIVARLNAAGGNWGPPEESSVKHLDAVARSLDHNGSTELKLQVVRGLVGRKFWESLARKGDAREAEIPVETAAIFLKDAIALKARRIPLGRRGEVLLVLNCIETPFLCLDSVVSEFRSTHGDWANCLGFREIWVAGPWAELVHRLDANEG